MSKKTQQTELIWSGKFTEEIKLPDKRLVDKITLPFQTIEVINEPRAEDSERLSLFGSQKTEGWRNKLIWGDNKLVISSLLKEYAGRINLIYIDPPFDVGADFSMKVKVGDEEITKEPSILEQKAYNDTWGNGTDSYLQIMYERLQLMRDLLAEDGFIFVHLGINISHYIKLLLDEIFRGNYRNEIVVKRITKNLQKQFAQVKSLPEGYDVIYLYSKTPNTAFKLPHVLKEEIIHPEGYWKDFWSNADRPTMRYELMGIKPNTGQWKWSQERATRAVQNYQDYLDKDGDKVTLHQYWLGNGNNLEFIRKSPTGKVEHWIEPSEDKFLDTLWTDISAYSFKYGYPTEKAEILLERIVADFSQEEDIVADFFCGSGTTGAVAERLRRRWIMCDLGRFAIHTSRKRLMEVQRILKGQNKPYSGFEILNLGKYERQYWQTTIGRGKTNKDKDYIKFIIKLYNGELLSGFIHLHGKKDNHIVHVGAVDAPVTMTEVIETVEESKANKLTKVDILGWEWEMRVNEEAVKHAKSQGIDLRLFQIPKEVMEKQAVEQGDVKFFELDHMAVDIERQGNKVRVKITGFAIPSDDLIPDELREKIINWSDYVDYWSVDWDYESIKSDKNNNSVFENNWQTFRTKQTPKLELETPFHQYETNDTYAIAVKAIDIFGNDTSKVIEVTVK